MKYLVFACIFLQVSCLDMIPGKKLRVTGNVVLYKSSDLDGYFLGLDRGNGNYGIILSNPVVSVEGNDSIALAKKSSGENDTSYVKILAPWSNNRTVEDVDRSVYDEVRAKLSISYNVVVP